MDKKFQVQKVSSYATRTTAMLKKWFKLFANKYVQKPSKTNDYTMQHTIIGVKSPKQSLYFYCYILGMNLVYHVHNKKQGFSLYYVAYCDSSEIPKIDVSTREGSDEIRKFCFSLPDCIEILHIHRSNTSHNIWSLTEKIQGGFGNFRITVPNFYQACERFKNLRVEIHKSPNQGGMKGMDYIIDPDGHLVEILPSDDSEKQEVDYLGMKIDQFEKFTSTNCDKYHIYISKKII